MPFHLPNGEPIQGHIIGIGRTGVVLAHDNKAIKIPRAFRDPHASPDQKEQEDITIEQNKDFLRNEKEAYQRLGSHDGIVEIIALSDTEIEMAYMKNGTLRQNIHTLGKCQEEDILKAHQSRKQWYLQALGRG